jgi:low affinity Fe/Cu permease
VRVADSSHVSSAAQDALDITRTLGGHVQSASVTTGAQAQAQLTVRIPVDKTEDAVTKLSALGTILSQQVSIQDLQEHLDSLVRRTRSVRAQIVKITARLESEQLSAERRAALELRRRNLQTELRSLRQAIRATHSTARFATVELSVVTPDSLGVVPTQSRLDRSLDKAVEILVWEGIVALVVLLVAAPLAVLAVIAWIVGRTYRRHEEDRLLATS